MYKLVLIFPLLLACSARAGHSKRAEKADQVFQMDRMLTIRIHMTAEQWAMMQPQKASRLATAMGVIQRPTDEQAIEMASLSPLGRSVTSSREEGQPRTPGLVGNEYAYVAATVEMDGKPYKKVGVRFKGQWSYTISTASLRRPMKLKFDHFVEDQRFHGIEGLSLNTSATDPSFLRESLAFALFREAGVPAPRTCFALVYLTVDGVHDSELLGLYTAIEEVNKDFLRRHFGTADGLLVRPERTRNLAYLGTDWREYGRYNVEKDGSPFAAGRFMDFTRLVQMGGDEEFCSDIDTYLDSDQFLRFLAANVLIINTDSFLVNGHNFYIYIHPKTGKVHFIPWDLHLSMGWHGRTIEELTALTITRPFREGNRLAERVMILGGMRDQYREYLREYATGCFAPERMHPRIEQLEQVVRQAQAIAKTEGKEFLVSMPSSSSQVRAELKPFVTGRVQSVLDQLAGISDGDPLGGRPAAVKPPPPPVRKPVVVPKPVVPPAVEKHKHPRPAVANGPTVPAIRPAAALMKARPATLPTAPAFALPLTQFVKAPLPQVRLPKFKPGPLPPHPLASALFRTIDVDRDSQINRDELLCAARHVFIAHGWTRRGPITEVSLALTFDRIGDWLNPYPASVDDYAPPTDPKLERAALVWAKALMSRIDPSCGGQATLHDLLCAVSLLFDQADTDHDGQLTAAEISAFLDEMVPRL